MNEYMKRTTKNAENTQQQKQQRKMIYANLNVYKKKVHIVLLQNTAIVVIMHHNVYRPTTAHQHIQQTGNGKAVCLTIEQISSLKPGRFLPRNRFRPTSQSTQISIQCSATSYCSLDTDGQIDAQMTIVAYKRLPPSPSPSPFLPAVADNWLGDGHD